MELLPCPFCGYTTVDVKTDSEKRVFSVECGGCFAGGPIRIRVEDAGQAWNTRVFTAAVTAKPQEGFSLIEVLIVLAIILILIAVALPALRGDVCVRKEVRTQYQLGGPLEGIRGRP